jgi:acylphosphatase
MARGAVRWHDDAVRRVHVDVRGRVQGVFFRASCAERARTAGVAVWVRNTLDGGVEAVFEGDDGAVDAIVAWCRRGPAFAEVDEVEVRDEPPLGEHDFRVTR